MSPDCTAALANNVAMSPDWLAALANNVAMSPDWLAALLNSVDTLDSNAEILPLITVILAAVICLEPSANVMPPLVRAVNTIPVLSILTRLPIMLDPMAVDQNCISLPCAELV